MRMTQARKTAVYRVITDSGGSGAGLHDTFRPVSRGPEHKRGKSTILSISIIKEEEKT